jgi:hypothetical protein
MRSPAQHGEYSSLGDKAPLSPARPTAHLTLAPPPEQLCPQGVLPTPPLLICQTSTTAIFIHRDLNVRGWGWVNLKTLYLVLSRHFGSSIKKKSYTKQAPVIHLCTGPGVGVEVHVLSDGRWCMCVCVCVCVSICLSVCVYPPVYVSVCLSVCEHAPYLS